MMTAWLTLQTPVSYKLKQLVEFCSVIRRLSCYVKCLHAVEAEVRKRNAQFTRSAGCQLTGSAA